jgi:eukaryotic-like serine/threonine-protein kinase
LAAAHAQGLIHRDIKPANILIEGGPNQRVKITDFGLARAADDACLTQSGILAGTPMFMAPEQVYGDKLDHRTDLFSLGSVLYTMSSGKPPFRADSTLAVFKRVAEETPRPIPEIIPEVPKWLCDLIARLHAKKPDERFESAQEVADLLTQHLASMPHPGNVNPPQLATPAAAVQAAPPPQEITDATSAGRRPGFQARRWVAAAAGLLTLLSGLGFAEATGVSNVGSTVVRLFSPEGTLEIQIDDPATRVQIDGSDLVISGAGAKEIRLKPGRYTVEARKDGKLVRRELVNVTRNGRQIVRVYQEPSKTVAPIEEAGPPEKAPDFVNSIGMEFVLLPTARFWMGGGGGKAGGKDVAIPYDFYLGRY